MMKNRAFGFYLTLVACVLALIDIILYTRVMYKMVSVFVLLIVIILIEVCALALNNKYLNDWLPVIQAALLGFTAARSFYVMVNQIGYVIAGLDTMDTIQPLIVFVAVALIAMLICILSAFLRQQKEAVD
ncbi:MAG: hypothetical protein IJT96_08790 [Lachnospiraceae bacterium]|mgnify:CR=1 FL=1|nr:hypothetical protein [Lachnospiraceae bacterium]